MRKLRVVVFLLFCAINTSLIAQTSNATLGGTVSDASGALIPGVMVTATNTATGIVTSVLSNESGTCGWRIPNYERFLAILTRPLQIDEQDSLGRRDRRKNDK